MAAVVAFVLVAAQWRNTLLFSVSVAAIAVAGPFLFKPWEGALHAKRSFFGMYRVEREGDLTLLQHGTTVHGAQFTDSAKSRMPLTYYHPKGPVGQAFGALRTSLEGKTIGVVGLGAGSLLCFSQPGQSWTFYEIDPAVTEIARNRKYFTFLDDCPVRASIVHGDARLSLAREPDGRFDLLVLDAFSSDAIPVHLLTREAFALYRRLLSPDGLLLLHMSNRYLDLEPVVAALAADGGLHGIKAEYLVDPRTATADVAYSSDWALLTRRVERFGALSSSESWRALQTRASVRPWTDDYSNVFGVIKW
jgi:SAM-dependent methyltransferase